ncbi:MAG: CBS domain-containing protein [Candidatus Dormiibacterota bacterium]
MTETTLPHRMTAGDVMSTELITAAPTTPIKQVAGLLVEHRISGVPVVNPEGGIVGIITEADLLLGKEAAIGDRFESLAAPVRERRVRAKARAEVASEAMSSPAVTIEPETTLAAAARLMRKHGVKRLPVVDAQQRLVGILSRHDILSALARPDPEIHREVVDGVLPRWLGLRPDAVDVAVDEGVVTLSGGLERRSDADILTHLVEGLDGVVAVRSRLSFRWDDLRAQPTRELHLD